MTTLTLLTDPQEVIGRRWSKDQPPEQAQVLGLARDALRFVFATGQRYVFEDFRKKHYSDSSRPQAQPQEDFASLKGRMQRTERFFTRLRDEPESAEEGELIQVIIDTLQFIASTGQYSALAEYLEHVEAGAPPYAVASFDTRTEAEAWLERHPSPPVSANVLIAGAYHDVVYDRETDRRRLPRNRDLHYYLAELKREEPPVAAASFATREEADAWLAAQPKPARWAWVLVDGEFYLAVYHPNVNYRALYPLAMADGYEVEPDTAQGE